MQLALKYRGVLQGGSRVGRHSFQSLCLEDLSFDWEINKSMSFSVKNTFK